MVALRGRGLKGDRASRGSGRTQPSAHAPIAAVFPTCTSCCESPLRGNPGGRVECPLLADSGGQVLPLRFPTPRHPRAPTLTYRRLISRNWLYQVTLCGAGYSQRRIENPRVGGSIPPLATIQIKALVDNDSDVECPIYRTSQLVRRCRLRSDEKRPTAVGHKRPSTCV
jgi:hypothetical protein